MVVGLDEERTSRVPGTCAVAVAGIVDTLAAAVLLARAGTPSCCALADLSLDATCWIISCCFLALCASSVSFLLCVYTFSLRAFSLRVLSPRAVRRLVLLAVVVWWCFLACLRQSRLLVSVESRPSPAPLLDLLLGLAPFLFPLDRIPHRRNKRAATKSVNTDECVRMRSAAVAKYQLQVRDRTALRRATGRQQLSTGGHSKGCCALRLGRCVRCCLRSMGRRAAVAIAEPRGAVGWGATPSRGSCGLTELVLPTAKLGKRPSGEPAAVLWL